MRDRHAQDGEFVGLAGQRAAGRHHVRQLRDVGGHLVPSPPLYLAVVLPAVDKQTNKHQSSQSAINITLNHGKQLMWLEGCGSNWIGYGYRRKLMFVLKSNL